MHLVGENIQIPGGDAGVGLDLCLVGHAVVLDEISDAGHF